MLQKLLVILVGLAMSLVGALSPSGLFAAEPAPAAGLAPGKGVIDETLTTVRMGEGNAFARVNVLWIEVDGRRVAEDAWGTGEIKELRFKVGVKGIDGTALAVGDRFVELHPTDVMTIRFFRGDFSYRHLGTSDATIQLQGTVKMTLVSEGDAPNRVRTQADPLDLDVASGPSSDPSNRAAYVVLTTGERVDTVKVEDGGSRLFTQEETAPVEGASEVGNLLAKWVKINGKMVREYTWGEAPVERVEFEPVSTQSRSVILTFNGETIEVPAGDRVIVTDFVGEHLVYQVPGDLLRIRLDGYAADLTARAAVSIPTAGGAGAPNASFEFSPRSPKTTDNVHFEAHVHDEDGVVVFRLWDFGDNTSSVLEAPSHRFKKPGPYEVTLTVTDNDLRQTTVSQTIVVSNAEPAPDFDFSPRQVTTSSIVAFTDRSYDTDGTVVNWSWDFGDGTTSYERHPHHTFGRGGNVTVTLTVTDDLGGRSTLSKVVIVRNAPPLANFGYSPQFPRTLEPVQFLDNSSDRDGRIVAWNWSFGDGSYATGANPNHAYTAPGLYTVSLTATDDSGESNTWARQLVVANRPAIVNFTWNPDAPPANHAVTFTSSAYDPDGEILLLSWDWGDGSPPNIGNLVMHSFPRAGTYEVTLTATDSSLQRSSLTRTVSIANSAPRAIMSITQTPTYRDVEVTFADSSYDPDGDRVAERFWDFGDGASSTERVATHRYTQTGVYEVVLTVKDEHGHTAMTKQSVRVVNAPPTASVTVEPLHPVINETVYLNASAEDRDSSGPFSYRWELPDGSVRTERNISITFPDLGNHTVRLTATDAEGGVSAPVDVPLSIQHAPPLAAFSVLPDPPATRGPVNFTDLSTSPNGAITSRVWNFGDDTTSTLSAPQHVYSAPGRYLVTLEVRDEMGQSGVAQQWIDVNARPVANFEAPSSVVKLGSSIQFTDASTDDDGYIATWMWSFGDGLTSTLQSPTYTYAEPGTYSVSLAVTDNNGTTDRIVKTVRVENTPPVARYYVDPASVLQANSPIRFISDDTTREHSYDPDGQTLVAWAWDFGGFATSAETNPTYAFAQSGLHRVVLRVSDGEFQSAVDSGSSKLVRVGADHPVTITVEAHLPGQRLARLSDAEYEVSLQVGTPTLGYRTYAKSLFVENLTNGEPRLDITIPAGAWHQDEVATLRIRHTDFMAAPLEKVVVLKDAHGVTLQDPLLSFNVPMPLVATIEAHPGNATTFLPLLAASNRTAPEGHPLYTNPQESFHGSGRVTYFDGVPTEGARVEVEVRYVPARTLVGIRDALAAPTNEPFLGWCRAAPVYTAADGSYQWRLDGDACISEGLRLHPAGRWEIRARASSGFAGADVSDTAVVYVDPTGGTLINLTSSLA